MKIRLVTLLKRDKFYLLLFTQLLFFVVLPFLTPHTLEGNLFTSILLSLVLLAGTNVVTQRGMFSKLGIFVSILFILATTVLEHDKTPIIVLLIFLVLLGFFTYIIYNIIIILLTTKEIKASLIAGALSGYLLIGVILSFFFLMLSAFDANALSATLDDKGFAGYLYFGLITMTTIGYGDIAPINPVAQMTSAFAAIISQFYLAVVVAVIVGKIISNKK